ncbi:MAG: invasion associated locus B family protein [Alphaproteobacteria bacterium]|nr:invasion associated locus B family protein [Alphaproteobacteria bacterium]
MKQKTLILLVVVCLALAGGAAFFFLKSSDPSIGNTAVPVVSQSGSSSGAQSAAGSNDSVGQAWFVRCNQESPENVTAKRGKCEAFQRLVVKESKKRLAEFAIGFPDDKAEARGIVVLPLGILLQAGVEMKIDEGRSFKFDVRYCDNGGCYAYLNLTPEILDIMRGGTKATLSFMSAKPQTVNVEMSLEGFGKALAEVS